MSNKVTATFIFETSDADGDVKCQVAYDSVTGKMAVSGTSYPWMINSVMGWIAKIKDSTAQARIEHLHKSSTKSQLPG